APRGTSSRERAGKNESALAAMTRQSDLHVAKPTALEAIVDEPGLDARAKLREWLSRYGLAECAGIGCALLAAFVVRHVTGNAIAAAYAGSWGETIGYAGVIIGRDFSTEARVARAKRERFSAGHARDILTDLLAEFGPS